MLIMATWVPGPGRITLYKGKEVVRKNVPTAKAVDELINLIRENGDWIEPAINGPRSNGDS
jgi:(E)-4-hydroxy-3-methylbut-2-enyl-diphosphate synthase